MHQIQNETYSSLETALHFALRDEERLNLECRRLHNAASLTQSDDYQTLCTAWGIQRAICGSLAQQLWTLNPDFNDGRFDTGYGDTRPLFLKPYQERLNAGLTILPVSKS